MKYFVPILVLVVICLLCFGLHRTYGGKADVIKTAQETVAQRDATIAQLKAAVAVYTTIIDKLDVVAQTGLTEQPGWQAMKIVERGGTGSVFYQLSASTNQYSSSVSTSGLSSFSWRSTTNDALEAAKLRRGQ